MITSKFETVCHTIITETYKKNKLSRKTSKMFINIVDFELICMGYHFTRFQAITCQVAKKLKTKSKLLK